MGLSILELSKTVTYEFWYDYVKLKNGEKANLCYMDTDSFIVYIKTNDIYKDIAEDIDTGFDTSNYELNRPLPKGKNKKVIGLIKSELVRKIMTEFIGLGAKIYSYLTDNNDEYKKRKGTKNVLSKENLNLKIIKTV